MKKNYFVLIVTVFLVNGMSAQIVDDTIDDPGDIAFTAYHNNPDGFSFVFLDNCPDGTTIRFVDEEWGGSAFESLNNEGEVLWTNNTGVIINQGTVIHIENADDDVNISASLGSASEINSGFGLAQTNDGIIAITGTRSSPGVFLAFFGDTTDSSLLGTSLVNGSTANQQASYGAGYYSGVSNCSGLTITECSERLNSFSNWTVATTFTYPESAMSNLVVNSVLSQQQVSIDTDVLCSPNPTSDKVRIVSNSVFSKVNVFNSLGMNVKSVNKNSKTIEIDLSDLTSGIYYLEIGFQEKKIIKKIVKE